MQCNVFSSSFCSGSFIYDPHVNTLYLKWLNLILHNAHIWKSSTSIHGHILCPLRFISLSDGSLGVSMIIKAWFLWHLTNTITLVFGSELADKRITLHRVCHSLQLLITNSTKTGSLLNCLLSAETLITRTPSSHNVYTLMWSKREPTKTFLPPLL